MPYSNPDDPRRMEKNRAWAAANAEKVAAYKRKYAEKHRNAVKERHAKWVQENPERVRESRKKWFLENKATHAAGVRSRQLSKAHRTPHWLSADDRWMIKEAYELATLRSKIFGFSWHVDHIIPLRGTTVSGLHVPTNLQVIPGVENCRKANKL